MNVTQASHRGQLHSTAVYQGILDFLCLQTPYNITIKSEYCPFEVWISTYNNLDLYYEHGKGFLTHPYWTETIV